MQLWQDGLVAMLAAVGLASLMWAVVKTVLYGRAEQRQEVVALVPAVGGCEGLEEQKLMLRALMDEVFVFLWAGGAVYVLSSTD